MCAVPSLPQAAELGVVNTFQHTVTLLAAGMTCEIGPSVPRFPPWENVSFGIHPSVLFEMFLEVGEIQSIISPFIVT